jgi:hypothetical protein
MVQPRRDIHSDENAHMKTKRLACLTIMFLGACSGTNPLEAYGVPSSSLRIDVGQEVRITMQNIGPGEYLTPPAIAGSAIEFVGMLPPSVSVPAGVTQIFRFKGVTPGNAVILFHNSDTHPDVSDTVVVR